MIISVLVSVIKAVLVSVIVLQLLEIVTATVVVVVIGVLASLIGSTLLGEKGPCEITTATVSQSVSPGEI